MSVKTDWNQHQTQYLDLTIAEVRSFEEKLRPEIAKLISCAKPPKKSLIAIIKLMFFRFKNQALYEARLQADAESSRLYENYRSQLKQISDEFNGKASSQTPNYSSQISDYRAEQLRKINSGISVSPYLPDFVIVKLDDQKIKRLLKQFNPTVFKGLGVARAMSIINSKPGDFVPEAGINRVVQFIKDTSDKIQPDIFEGINETNAHKAIDTLHLSAGNLFENIQIGTPCFHAGVLDAKQTLDDEQPCFTSIDPQQKVRYAKFAIQDYIQTPKAGYSPQIISGVVSSVLKCAVMKGTSFNDISAKHLDSRPGLLKPLIKEWAEGRCDALSGTNGGDHELLIIRPKSHFKVTSCQNIPLTPEQLAKVSLKQASLATLNKK